MTKSNTIDLLQAKIADLESHDRNNTTSGMGSSFNTTSPRQTSSRQHDKQVTSENASTQTKPSRRSSSASATDKDDDASLITMHIREMRELKQQLEATRLNNDALRRQLEERLALVERDAKMLNEPGLNVNLIRDNDRMRQRLAELSDQKREMDDRVALLIEEKQS